MQWYYSKNDAPCGPVDDTELKRLIRAGDITEETLIWNSTMGEEWKSASTFGFLFFPPVDLQPPGIPSEVESGSATPSEGTTPNRYLVSRARASLKGHWGMAVAAGLICYAIGLFIAGAQMGLQWPTMIHAQQAQMAVIKAGQQQHLSIVQMLYPKLNLPLGTRVASDGLQFLRYLIAGPFAVGWCFFFLNIALRSEAKVTSIFKGFSLFWKAVGAYFLILLMILFWGLLFMIPVIAFLFWKKIDVFHGEYPDSPLFFILFIPSVILLIVKMLSYAMTYFVLADDPTVGPLRAIRKSTLMMAGRKWKYICLQFRFIGWGILSLLTCYIGLLWLIPYMATAKAHFYLDVKNRADLPKA